MNLRFSQFGENLCGGSGIGELMRDLGDAIASGGDAIRMLGGGQPSHIDMVDEIWRKRMHEVLAKNGMLEHMLGNYEPPAGNPSFRSAVALLLRKQYGWDLTGDNVAVTSGGQAAFYFLFNALAGRFKDGSRKQILLPLVPEYIGYANQGVDPELFQSRRPILETIDKHLFKYHVDFDNLDVGENVSAICVSRPTNPTGNVLTDDEIERLLSVAHKHSIFLIIDNAYGAPFPGAIFTKTRPVWDPSVILTLSLSKLGLPGTRTGIVIASEEVINAIESMTSIIGLANNNIGQVITLPLIESGQIIDISDRIIRPYYQSKSEQAIRWMHEFFDDSIPYRIHRSEGAFFLWMWFEGLPISSQQLYERLKERGVLIVPGHYFFYGSDLEVADVWKHRDECIRVTFTMPEHVVRDGYRIIAEVVTEAYNQ